MCVGMLIYLHVYSNPEGGDEKRTMYVCAQSEVRALLNSMDYSAHSYAKISLLHMEAKRRSSWALPSNGRGSECATCNRHVFDHHGMHAMMKTMTFVATAIYYSGDRSISDT
jgi:hypothetical protein